MRLRLCLCQLFLPSSVLVPRQGKLRQHAGEGATHTPFLPLCTGALLSSVSVVWWSMPGTEGIVSIHPSDATAASFFFLPLCDPLHLHFLPPSSSLFRCECFCWRPRMNTPIPSPLSLSPLPHTPQTQTHAFLLSVWAALFASSPFDEDTRRDGRGPLVLCRDGLARWCLHPSHLPFSFPASVFAFAEVSA